MAVYLYILRKCRYQFFGKNYTELDYQILCVLDIPKRLRKEPYDTAALSRLNTVMFRPQAVTVSSPSEEVTGRRLTVTRKTVPKIYRLTTPLPLLKAATLSWVRGALT